MQFSRTNGEQYPFPEATSIECDLLPPLDTIESLLAQIVKDKRYLMAKQL